MLFIPGLFTLIVQEFGELIIFEKLPKTNFETASLFMIIGVAGVEVEEIYDLQKKFEG